MFLRFCLVALVMMGVSAREASAQATTGAADPVGVWRGTSVCLVHPSACNDEITVYRITRAKSSDSISMDGRRIVDAREVEMGILGCRLAADGASFTCSIPSGVWHFTVRRDSLVGELRQLNDTKFRVVRAARSRPAPR